MRGLEGKIAIVTGASKGLGRGIALRLAEEGVSQIICSRSQDEIEVVAEEIRAKGGRAIALSCDVTDRAQIASLVEQAAGVNGRIDILVNNAARMTQPAPFLDYDDDVWEDTIRGGLTSAYYMMKAVVPHMKNKGGRIVNITSLGGLRGVKGMAAYGAAKTGLIGLTRTAANEWGEHGITVNCISPMGYTDGWKAFVEATAPGANPFDALGVRRSVLGYAGDPQQDIAPAVAFLCSDDARYITGAILPVDGGLLDVE